METLHERSVALDLPRQLARARGVSLAQCPLAFLFKASPLRVREARARAEHCNVALLGRELPLWIERGWYRVKGDRRRGTAVREGWGDGSDVRRAAVALDAIALALEVGTFPLAVGAFPLTVAVVLLAFTVGGLVMSMGSRAVATKGDEADAFGGFRCSRVSNGHWDRRAFGVYLRSNRRVHVLCQEIGDKHSEGDTDNRACRLHNIRESQEVDDELGYDANDNGDNHLRQLGKGVLDEDALEEPIEEEVGGWRVCVWDRG